MLLFTAACAGQSPSCACCLCTFASLLSDQGVLVWLAELLWTFRLLWLTFSIVGLPSLPKSSMTC